LAYFGYELGQQDAFGEALLILSSEIYISILLFASSLRYSPGPLPSIR